MFGFIKAFRGLPAGGGAPGRVRAAQNRRGTAKADDPCQKITNF
jgi:hypothetical protein